MWYALRTAPQREHKARDLLGRVGIEAVVPTELRYLRRTGNRKKVERAYPLVVGYVLVKSPGIYMPWHLVFTPRTAPYIKAVVSFDGRPAPIDDATVQRLVAMSSAAVPYASSVNTRRASFSRGERVAVVSGPLKGLEAKIEDISQCRAHIVVSMFGKPHRVSLDLSDVSAA